ncbi:MAG: fibronectin type III domain-containing protein [Candidatus Korobacteraceae bacterium]
MRAHLLFLLAALCLCLAAGCGTPGAPMPPALELPRPVNDLAAERKGDRVLLSWSQPIETMEGRKIRRPGLTLVCRSLGEFPMSECGQPLKTLRPEELHSTAAPGRKPQVGFEDVLPAGMQSATQFAVYTIQVLNHHGKSAGLSNQVPVPLAPALPPVKDLRAEVTPDSVLLRWTAPERPGTSTPTTAKEAVVGGPGTPGNVSYFFRVFRKPVDAAVYTLLREVPFTSGTVTFSDRSFEWEHAYHYKVTGVTRVQLAGGVPMEFESEDSPVVQVLPHDIFPPATPTGLQAVFSGTGQKSFIDLTWAPNSEADLAGYNVFRAEPGTAPARINPQLVRAPAFRDDNVAAGHSYIYSVSAVDERGNESPRSEPATESIP